MEKTVLYGLVVMLMCLVDSGFSQGEVKWMSEEEAKWEQFLIKSQLPILVTMTSSLCGVPCVILEDQVSQLAKTYGNHIIFYKADILEKPFFETLYNVLNVPTLIVFKGGKEIKRLEKDFYWGAVHDLIFQSNIFYSAPPPSDSAPPPFDPASPLTSPLIKSFSETYESWKKAMDKTQLPILVTITSSLCGAPCVILKDQVARLVETYGNQIVFYTANILENPFFAQVYEVVNVPSVIVFKDGKEIFRFEKLSDWGNIYDLVFQSIFAYAPDPHPSDSDSPLPLQSGE